MLEEKGDDKKRRIIVIKHQPSLPPLLQTEPDPVVLLGYDYFLYEVVCL